MVRRCYRIGEVVDAVGVSADTLRYYERISLLPRIERTAAGTRSYAQSDLSRLRFILRAKAMRFTLAEIATLLELRESPGRSRPSVRQLARSKIAEIDAQMQTLSTLRRELRQLAKACSTARSDCPILSGIEDATETGGTRTRMRRR